MDPIVIKTGPLTSYNSLHYYMTPKLSQIRELYHTGAAPKILMDMTSLEAGTISISALTAFLSICKKVRDFLGCPIPATIKWDPRLQGFLADLNFFIIADKFKLFKWEPDGIIGGYPMGKINPNSKLLYYSDISPVRNLELEQLGLAKASLKQRIAPHFLMRCANLFHGFDDRIEDIISNTSLELIVNSLMHAEDVAFIGLQRTQKRITVAVCDSGIGFLKSLSRTYNNVEYIKSLTHIQAIVIGCLIQKSMHGLRLAISEVLNYDENLLMSAKGWVIVSSYDSEIRWELQNWQKAVKYFDQVNALKNKPNFDEILGLPAEGFLNKEKVKEGYWRRYENFLVGSRITFEIQVDK